MRSLGVNPSARKMATTNKIPRDDPGESERFIETAKSLNIGSDGSAFVTVVGKIIATVPQTKKAPVKETGAHGGSAKVKR